MMFQLQNLFCNYNFITFSISDTEILRVLLGIKTIFHVYMAGGLFQRQLLKSGWLVSTNELVHDYLMTHASLAR